MTNNIKTSTQNTYYHRNLIIITIVAIIIVICIQELRIYNIQNKIPKIVTYNESVVWQLMGYELAEKSLKNASEEWDRSKRSMREIAATTEQYKERTNRFVNITNKELANFAKANNVIMLKTREIFVSDDVRDVTQDLTVILKNVYQDIK